MPDAVIGGPCSSRAPVPAASVIVRAKDKADTIERVFRALRRQTVQPEIVVVDSGSRDATVRIARRFCDVLVEMPPEEFSYGGALNLGARHASAPVNFSLSAHCAPARTDWIERALAHYRDPRVAATAGGVRLPDGTPVAAPFLQDAGHARRHPWWGYSNHAGSWRAAVWRRFPFDEHLPAAEDREWSWRVLDAGWRIVVDPALRIEASHRGRQSWAEWFGRRRREMAAHVRFDRAAASYGLRELTEEWWVGDPLDPREPVRQRLSARRALGLAGKYAGARTGRP